MSVSAGLMVLRTILVLLIGLEPASAPAPRTALESLAPVTSVVSAEIDLDRARAIVAKEPALRELLYGGLTPEAARASAASVAGAPIAMQGSELLQIFASMRRLGVFWLGIGDDGDEQRGMLVVQRDRDDDILPKLLKTMIAQEKVITVDYLAWKIYGGPARDPVIWAAEAKGRVAVALDPLAIQAFILKSKKGDLPVSQRSPVALRVEADGPVLLNNIMLLMDMDDRSEVAAFTSIFEWAAWERAELTFDDEGLDLRAEIDPGAMLAEALPGPEAPPALLGIVPDGIQLAAVVSLRDSTKAWAFARKALGLIALAKGNDIEQVMVQAREMLGIDLEGDLVPNIVAVGVVMTRWSLPASRSQDPIVLLEMREPMTAEVATRMLSAWKPQGEEVVRTEADGVETFAASNIKIVKRGRLVAIGSAREERNRFDRVVVQMTAGAAPLGEDLRARFPEARSYAVIDPSGMLNMDTPLPLEAGLSFDDNELHLRVAVEPGDIVAVIRSAVAAMELRQKRRMAVSVGRRIARECRNYAVAHNRRLPENLEAIGGRRPAVCPVSGKPFVYNRNLAGVAVDSIKNPGATILGHGPEGQPGGGVVIYVAGNANWLDGESFERAVAVAKEPIETDDMIKIE